MTTYLVPATFNSVDIRGQNQPSGIDTQAFELPVPIVQSGIIPAAGGSLFDFNYGDGAKLIPRPFSLVMTVYAVDEFTFNTVFNSFFGLPPAGFYGLTATFTAKIHGSIDYLSCQVELESYSFTQDVRWYDSDKKMISGMAVVFKPVDLFS